MDEKRSIHSGRVTLVIKSEPDYDGDFSWLGKWTSYRKASASFPLYSVDEDAIRVPGSDLWRDRRGRIVAEPGDDSSAREYRFLTLEGGGNGYQDETKHRLRYLFQDADRLRDLARGEWSFLGIVARVYVDGRRLGSASCYGFESDAGPGELEAEGRNLAREAIEDARTFLRSLKGAA